jgi:hypothetical protein
VAKPKTGAAQVNVELAPEVLDRLKRFADERGQTLKYVIGRAIIRHMDHPPPVAVEPPLPPGEPDPPPAKKPTAKPKKGGRK